MGYQRGQQAPKQAKMSDYQPEPSAPAQNRSEHPVDIIQAMFGSRAASRQLRAGNGIANLVGRSRFPVSPRAQGKPQFRGISQEWSTAPSTGWVRQPKLTIGAPNDPYEQEADRVAEQVVQQINNPSVQQGEVVQREVGEADKDILQQKPLLQLQSQSAADRVAASPEIESEIGRARSGGQPLVPGIRTPMERAFGADFSGVRVHADAQADQLNRAIQAKAFTTRQDMFFRQGAYDPGSRSGQELIAHELTHVVQQRGMGGYSGSIQRDPKVGFELETKIPMYKNDTADIPYKTPVLYDYGMQDEDSDAQLKGPNEEWFHIEADVATDDDNKVSYSVAEFVTGAFSNPQALLEAIKRVAWFLHAMGTEITTRDVPITRVIKRYRKGLAAWEESKTRIEANKNVWFGKSSEGVPQVKPQVTFGVKLDMLPTVTRELLTSNASAKSDTKELDTAEEKVKETIKTYGKILQNIKDIQSVKGFLTFVYFIKEMGGRQKKTPYAYSKAAFYFLPRVNLHALYNTLSEPGQKLTTAVLDTWAGASNKGPLVPSGYYVGGATDFGPSIADWMQSIHSPTKYKLDSNDRIHVNKLWFAGLPLKEQAQVRKHLIDIYKQNAAADIQTGNSYKIGLYLRDLDENEHDELMGKMTHNAMRDYFVVEESIREKDLMSRRKMVESSSSIGEMSPEKAKEEGAVIEFRRMWEIQTSVKTDPKGLITQLTHIYADAMYKNFAAHETMDNELTRQVYEAIAAAEKAIAMYQIPAYRGNSKSEQPEEKVDQKM